MGKKRKINYKRLRLTLIVVVFAYFFLRSIPMFIVSKAKTVPAEEGTIVESVECEGIVLRNETVYKTESQGKLKLYEKDGSKVGKGIAIAEVQNETLNNYNEQLDKIDNEIEDLKKRLVSQNEVLKEDINKSQEKIDSIMAELQNSIASQDYDEVKILKDRLLVATNKKDAITNEKKLVADQIDNALNKKNDIIQKIKKARLVHYSQTAGIVSYNIDGLEEKLSAKKADKYSVKDFKVLNQKKETKKQSEDVKIGQSIFKIIENQTWFIMVKTNDKSLKSFKEKEAISVKLKENILEGTIFKIDKTNKDTLVIIKLNEYLYNHLNDRYLDVELITNTYNGLIIPKTSIVEKDGIKGVYVKSISGVIEFRPIKILGQDDKNVIIEEGEDGFIKMSDNDDELTKTVRLLDEVFEDGKKGKDGQIIYYF